MFGSGQLCLEHDLIKNTTSYSLQLDMYVSLEHVWIGQQSLQYVWMQKTASMLDPFHHVFEFGTILDVSTIFGT